MSIITGEVILIYIPVYIRANIILQTGSNDIDILASSQQFNATTQILSISAQFLMIE